MNTVNHPSVRKSLPLSQRDLQDLAMMRASEVHRHALSRLVETEVTDESSEATLLHAVMEAGINAVRQQVEDQGYAQIADQMDTAGQRATARRRRPSCADE